MQVYSKTVHIVLFWSHIPIHIDNKTANKCDVNKSSDSNMYEKEVFIVLLSFFVLMVVLVLILLFYPSQCIRRKTRKKRTTDSVEASFKNGDLI